MEFRQVGSLREPAVGTGAWKTFDVTSEPDISVRRRIMDDCVAHQVTLKTPLPCTAMLRRCRPGHPWGSEAWGKGAIAVEPLGKRGYLREAQGADRPVGWFS